MEFVRNMRGNTGKLEAIHRSATQDAECVLAAVAYVTQERPFLQLCSDLNKPLKLYARYDYTGPVSPEVLDWFFAKKQNSSNYEIRLVPDIFHPKIIWWKGIGVYIGSANLTKAAWFKNFEAGLYLSEEEMKEAGFYDDLEDYFDEIHQASTPVTKEIAEQMKQIAIEGFGRIDSKLELEFNKTRLIPELDSLSSVTKIPGNTRRRTKFMAEWSQTLEYLRDIANRLALAGNEPTWVLPGTAKGVLADQFLHAFYYNQVKQGSAYLTDVFYEKNRNNRDMAFSEAEVDPILWTKKRRN